MKGVAIQVFGKVQGVWFRASTRNKALELGIKGTVQNQADGSVYIEANGTDAAIQELIDWCRVGPVHAAVTNVLSAEMAEKDFSSFEVVR